MIDLNLRSTKLVVAGFALAVSVSGVAACGSSGSVASKTVSEKTFCKAATTFSSAVNGDATEWAKVQAAAKTFGNVGTPKSMSKQEKAGLKRGLDLIASAKSDKDMSAAVKKLSKDEEAELNTVDGYLTKTCDDTNKVG